MRFIYALVDPRDVEIRYIGQTIRPKERLQNHCKEKSKCHRSHWIQQLRSLGLKPQMHIMEELEESDPWKDREIWWIAYGRAEGWNLTNNTDGGDGVNGLPEETRKRMALNWLGRKHRPESLVKIGLASKGRKHDDAWRKLMHDKMIGRIFTDEHKSNLSKSNQKLSDEDIAKIRAMLDRRVSQYAIADLFGVHQGTISNIKNRKSYK